MVGSRSGHPLTTTAWTAMSLVTFASFLCLCAAESTVAYKTMTVVNNCAFPVWPAIVGSTDLPPRMRKLRAGESYSWKADPFWSGSIWGRTGCLFNSQGLGGCDSGDCGGNLQCKDDERQDIMAVTKADFELLGGKAKPDTYSVTLEKGYNLPMSVIPSYAANNTSSRRRPCGSMACTADANAVCPKELQEKKKGSVVTACKGHYDGYLTNSPAFSKAFKKVCPRAFPFRSGTICPPSTAFYTLTFCPRPGPPSH